MSLKWFWTSYFSLSNGPFKINISDTVEVSFFDIAEFRKDDPKADRFIRGTPYHKNMKIFSRLENIVWVVELLCPSLLSFPIFETIDSREYSNQNTGQDQTIIFKVPTCEWMNEWRTIHWNSLTSIEISSTNIIWDEWFQFWNADWHLASRHQRNKQSLTNVLIPNWLSQSFFNWS